MAAAAGAEERELSLDGGAREVKGGERRVTSDPADRLILSFQRPPLSLLIHVSEECRGGVKKSRQK